LLTLPEEIQRALLERKITERHARAFLSLENSEDQIRLLGEILEKGLNVKQTEERVRRLLEKKPSQRKARRKSVSRDIRIALNTIRQSVNMVQKSGMNVIADEQDKGNYYEVIIRIPK